MILICCVLMILISVLLTLSYSRVFLVTAYLDPAAINQCLTVVHYRYVSVVYSAYAQIGHIQSFADFSSKHHLRKTPRFILSQPILKTSYL